MPAGDRDSHSQGLFCTLRNPFGGRVYLEWGTALLDIVSGTPYIYLTYATRYPEDRHYRAFRAAVSMGSIEAEIRGRYG